MGEKDRAATEILRIGELNRPWHRRFAAATSRPNLVKRELWITTHHSGTNLIDCEEGFQATLGDGDEWVRRADGSLVAFRVPLELPDQHRARELLLRLNHRVDSGSGPFDFALGVLVVV